MLHWSEQLKNVYIAGASCEKCFNPAAVTELLSVDWYAKQWPLIPRAELDASAVDFPYQSVDGEWTSRKVLMHKRRVSEEHLHGTAPAKVCEDCHDAFWKTAPTLSKWCLSNFNWLGRHLPIFRDATLGHQLLLALGRVLSTKVYLSSKGVDVVTRQHNQSWRKKFLQQGISGTAIVTATVALMMPWQAFRLKTTCCRTHSWQCLRAQRLMSSFQKQKRKSKPGQHFATRRSSMCVGAHSKNRRSC